MYGATSDGGSGGDCAAKTVHCGVVYRLDRDGSETVLHRFTGADGKHPIGELLPDAQGNLYGVTMGGGISCWRTLDGCGTVFKLAPDGTESVLFFFNDSASEQYPHGRMALDDDGALYGLVEGGGFWGEGELFKLVPGHSFSAVHIFDSRTTDGTAPVGFVRLADGTFYGATSAGGANGLGTVFKIAPDGTESVLHSFAGGTADGQSPAGSVTLDGAGNIYGPTAQGGNCRVAQGCGVAYRIAPDGTESILHHFRKRSGMTPAGPLAFDTFGNLRGATVAGGASNLGTAFRLSP
ncbi:MAG: hypothetical protein JOZ72_19000 [Alphaproteobacteria bacterium]|nr:hypothetical protein [Alphaproteobacteria bacterium]